MHVTSYSRRTELPVSRQAAFAWHQRPGALERLVPPWERVTVTSRTGGMEDGGRVELTTQVGPIAARWVAEHYGYEPGEQFCDRQLDGPFARWEHRHRFKDSGPNRCLLKDEIEYAIPGGWLGRLLAGKMVQERLARMFAYRHRTTRDDLAAHTKFGERSTMKVLVTGASGLVGAQLSSFLKSGGHEVIPLVRRPAKEGEIHWDPAGGKLDPSQLEGADAVVHLAGENIAEGRWSEAKKQRIRDSRVQSTELLARTLAGLEQKPKALVSASAIGYYGDRGEELLTEESDPGQGFLPDVCQAWEGATQEASASGIRVVCLRIGVVLSPQGGALAKMLLPFRLGAGGRVGSGRQVWSWISIDDLVGTIHHALMTDSLNGPVNAVAPDAVTNREFTKTLGRVLGRPTIFPMPAFAARLALGEMANDLLLASARVVPTRLTDSGYAYRQPDLETALRHLLGKS